MKVCVSLPAIALGIFAACPMWAVTNNPGDPLFCQPNEGVQFLIVNGGSGVFTVDSDCYSNNINNLTTTSITTGMGGTLTLTRGPGAGNYTYTPPTATFTGLDTFSIAATTAWNSAGGTGSAGGTSRPGGPVTFNVTLNVLPSTVVLAADGFPTPIPVPTGSITGCTVGGNAGQGPTASAIYGCVKGVGPGSVSPAHGHLSQPTTTTLVYVPNRGYAGPDTFTYQALGVNADGATALNSGDITVQVTVSAAAPPLLSSSASTVTLGQPVTFTATETDTSLTGAVDFYDGVVLLGYGSLASGVASYSTPALGTGPHQITAVFGAVSAPLTVNVDATPATLLVQQPAITGFGIPLQIGVTDLNGDGFSDLVVADGTSGLGVLLGSAGGTFSGPVFYPDGTGSQHLALGDFNTDEKVDVFTTVPTGSGRLLFGAGNGTFGTALGRFIPATSPLGVASGDFNEDGNFDLVVASSGHVGLITGSGNGGFSGGSPFAIPSPFTNAGTILVGDFNADGHADFAAQDTLTGSAYIYFGDGTGAFTAGPVLAPGPSAAAAAGIAIADFNGDGKPDLAVAGASSVTVYLNSGTGTFTAQPTISFLYSLTAIAATDFNGDGKSDLIFADNSDEELRVQTGDGAGNFTESFVSSPAGNRLLALEVGDFNGDGKVDVAASTSESDVLIFFGQTPAPQTITFPAIPDHLPTDPPFTITATASSDLPVSYSAVGSCTVVAISAPTVRTSGERPQGLFPPQSATVTITGPGTCSITATQAGNTLIAPATPVTQTFNIGKLAATVTLGGLTQAYTGSPISVTVTTVPANLTVTVTYNGSAAPPTAVGSYAVLATVQDTTYSGTATGTLVISQASATITLSGLVQNYTGSPVSVTVTTNPPSLAVIVTYNGSSTPPTAPGSYAVVATVQDANYSGTAVGTLVIGRGSAIVTLSGLAQTYTGNPIPVTAKTSPAGLAVTITYNGSATPPTAVGSYQVIATVTDSNYSGQAIGALVIAPVQPTISWNPASLVWGSALGPAQLDATANTPGTFVYTPAAGSMLPVGTQALNLTFTPTNTNYAATTANVLIYVLPAPQTITFAPIGNHLASDAPFALTATVNSGNPIVFTVVSGPATISGSTLTITGVGTVTVQAAVAATANYAAGSVTQTFTVSPASSTAITAVVNSASLVAGPLAPGYLATVFGTQMAAQTATASGTLPTTLGGASVSIIDGAGQTTTAQLLYVSPTQINLLTPSVLASGKGTITVNSGSQTASLAVQIGAADPGIFTAPFTGAGPATGFALHVANDGTTTNTALASCTGTPAVCTATPIVFASTDIRIFLVLFGTGISGAGTAANTTVTVAGTNLSVQFSGAQGQFAGLDQVNAEIPRTLVGTGQATVQVSVAGQLANPVGIAIQ